MVMMMGMRDVISDHSSLELLGVVGVVGVVVEVLVLVLVDWLSGVWRWQKERFLQSRRLGGWLPIEVCAVGGGIGRGREG